MDADVNALVAALVATGSTVATAESLTGGQVAAALTSVPGSSRTYLGGVVSYATRVKIDLLGIPTELVAAHGVISTECAAAMAVRVRDLLKATYGVSTTGVAGPDGQEGHPAGTVFVAVAGPHGVDVESLRVVGSRAEIQSASVDGVLGLLHGMLLREEPDVG